MKRLLIIALILLALFCIGQRAIIIEYEHDIDKLHQELKPSAGVEKPPACFDED
jgi:hypothetical protein